MKPSGRDPRTTLRFREAALPHLDDVYTLARYLLRDPVAAEDAVQECYLRALQHFDTYRGPSMKPWLLAILRNVCQAEFARRIRVHTESLESVPIGLSDGNLWDHSQESPEDALLREREVTAIWRIVDALAEPFREALLLREVQDLSYREISKIVGSPIGTVMSRIARARAMLREAWMTGEEHRT